jgi:hypothetical protein
LVRISALQHCGGHRVSSRIAFLNSLLEIYKDVINTKVASS